ncbi:MAG TPA: ferritin-like domain-containing protein [Phycisphaerales bacterium]|nr:ferritin-like domain-containing protein [Phycisphaerales bacterium]
MSHTPSPSRRELLATLGTVGATVGAGLALGACAAPQTKTGRTDTNNKAIAQPDMLDDEIFNFALNLEYMEAEYYTRGAYGQGIQERGAPIGRKPGEVNGGRKVRFSNETHQAYAEELAFNEAAHVRFYHRILRGQAVDRPEIDFVGGMSAVFAAAGIVSPGTRVDPFEDEMLFYLGGMLFEDTGITAYRGASAFITDRTLLGNAAGVLAVEAYHMGMVRALLYNMGSEAREYANKISELRDRLDGPEDLDQGIEVEGKPNIVPCDSYGVAFARKPRQVANIVFGKPGANAGGFYPRGLSGGYDALMAL